MAKALCDYEVRLSESRRDATKWTNVDLINCFKKLCSHWTFNLERGEETGYMHFQCSIRLRKRSTKATLLREFMKSLDCEMCDAPQYIEPTVKGVHTTSHFNYDCYASKAQTSISNWNSRDWGDKDPIFIPDQFLGKLETLRPFQQVIFDSQKNQKRDDPNFRLVNVLYNKGGNIGKSVIAAICRLYGSGFLIPPFNDSKEIMQILCDYCISKELRRPGPILIDLPRALDQSKLSGIYNAIEQLKTGYLYDPRHSYKEWWIHSPVIWVFTNELPDVRYLSKDRWRIWEVTEPGYELVPYVPPSEDEPTDIRVNKLVDIIKKEPVVKKILKQPKVRRVLDE